MVTMVENQDIVHIVNLINNMTNFEWNLLRGSEMSFLEWLRYVEEIQELLKYTKTKQ